MVCFFCRIKRLGECHLRFWKDFDLKVCPFPPPVLILDLTLPFNVSTSQLDWTVTYPLAEHSLPNRQDSVKVLTLW